MENRDKHQRTPDELLEEIQTLQERLAIAEGTLQAIMQGEVDALVVSSSQGTQVFTLQSADQSYRVLVEEMQQSAVILSLEGLILYCNQSFSDLLKRSLETLIGSYFHDYVSPQDASLFQTHLNQVRERRKSAFELFLVDQNQVEVPVYLSMNHLNLDDVMMNCLVITDLTEQKRHEKTLASERLARLMLEQAGEVILVCDHTGTIIRASQIANQILGNNLISRPFDTLSITYIQPRPNRLDQPELSQSETTSSVKTAFTIASVLNGRTFQGLEVELATPTGQILNLMLNARPLTDRDNHFRGAIVILTDITRRKQAENALQQSQAQLQQQLAEIENIYQCAPIGLNVLDTELRFVRINQRLAEINGLSAEAHIGHTIRELFPDLADQAEQLLRPILATGEPCLNVEINGETPAQPGVKRTWLESFLPLKDGDRVIGINTVCEEITDRKRIEAERQKAEEELRQAKENLENRVLERTAALNQMIQDLKEAQKHITASLREKEVLLKEIHHRVKNNLGIVSSLLQMQIRRAQDPQTNLILQDSQNRIASIALVHEKLYRSEDLANINLSQYIQDLTVYLFDSYNISSSQIQLLFQVENVHLAIEMAIPFGLIINELVSNALKHAFPDDRSGAIQIQLAQTLSAQPDHPQTVVLIIQDNGIGLPSDFELKTTKTLGLTLVQGLVKQIGATLEITSQQGTQFKITLTKP